MILDLCKGRITPAQGLSTMLCTVGSTVSYYVVLVKRHLKDDVPLPHGPLPTCLPQYTV